MKKIIYLLFISLALTACNNPLNKKYSDETLEQDAKAIVKSNKLNEDELKMLSGYIVMAKFGGKDLTGKTYSDILNEAKKMKNEEEELALKAKKEEEEKIAKFKSIINVALYDKGYRKEDFEDYLEYYLVFENKSDKNIRAIKGSLLITDLFDTEIKNLNFVNDDGIPAHTIVKNSYTTDYNQFEDSDIQYRSKNLKDLKTKWVTEKIIFEDGTTLE